MASYVFDRESKAWSQIWETLAARCSKLILLDIGDIQSPYDLYNPTNRSQLYRKAPREFIDMKGLVRLADLVRSRPNSSVKIDI
jgi:hypothetical protein